MDAPLLRTPLYDWHVSHGGRMVDFAGWAMPVQYTSIIQEHLAIRSAVGMADISHMGRLRFEGPGAAVFLAELLTRRVADMELGQIRYSLVTNDAGGILDDVLVGYYHNSHGQPFFLLVVNAGNRAKIVDWVDAHLPKQRAERPGQEIIWTDVSRLWAMFAIQGPRSVELLQPLVDVDLQSMRYYRGAQIADPPPRRPASGLHHQPHRLYRRGRLRVEPWGQHRPGRVGSADGVGQAAGRGARRTRRPRYAAARGRHAVVRPRAFGTDRPVPGRAGFRLPSGGLRLSRPRCLAAIQKQPPKSVRIGLEMAGKRAARQGCTILAGGRSVGQVTSGSYSPTLGKPIAMGYVAPGVRPTGHRTSNRHSRPRRAGPRRGTPVLPPQQSRDRPSRITHERCAT